MCQQEHLKEGTKSRDCYSLSSTSSIAVSLTLIEFLRLLYLPPAVERIAGFYIRFTGHARLLGQKNQQQKKTLRFDRVTTRPPIKRSVSATQKARF